MFRQLFVPVVLLLAVTLCSCGEASQPATPTVIVTASPGNSPLPTPTLMPSTILTTTISPGSAESMAMSYYQAIRDQKYSVAYTYLDAGAINTTTGQKLTLASFMQLALDSDSAGGPVSIFSAAAFPPLVVMTVSRSDGPYHVHLQIRQAGSSLKITSLDRI